MAKVEIVVGGMSCGMCQSAVQEALSGVEGVAEAAVVGVEDSGGLVVPVAFAVLVAGAATGAATASDAAGSVESILRAHARAHLESYKVPRELHLLHDFPRTHLGKVDRGALKRVTGSAE